MSIAYQALVLFLYALPGILFRKRLSAAGPFRQQRSIADELALSIGWAVCWHALWIAVWAGVCRFLPVPTIDLDSAIMHAMVQFGQNQQHFGSAVESVTHYPLWVFAYFGSINACALFAATLLLEGHKKEWKLCRCVAWLQDHEPHYQRQTEWKSVLEIKPRTENEEVVRILTMVVELGKAPFLFVGQLEDVYFGPDGNPERFVLNSVARRALLPSDRDGDESVDENKMHPILGDSFVVRASEAKTLNMVVWYVSEEPQPGQQP